MLPDGHNVFKGRGLGIFDLMRGGGDRGSKEGNGKSGEGLEKHVDDVRVLEI